MRAAKQGLGAIALATGIWASVAWPASALVGVTDHLPAMLSMIGSGHPAAWMAFEAAYARDLDPTHYRGRTPAQKLVLMRSAMGMAVPVGPLQTFAARWRADFEGVASRLEPLGGDLPTLGASMAYTADTRATVVATQGERTVVALNARYFLPYDPVATRLAFANVISQVALSSATNDSPQANNLARQLQVEGMRMLLQERAVPGLPPYRYLNASPRSLVGYERHRRAIAQAVMRELDGNGSGGGARFFGGQAWGDPWPAGAGRYMAYILAFQGARDRNPMEILAQPAEDYLFTVRPLLEQLAGAIN